MENLANLWQIETNPEHMLKHIHMVGISGAGMSAIADILLFMGYEITGSDLRSDTPEIRNLIKSGAKIYSGHDWQFTSNPDLVVYSSAIPDSNIELIQAKAANVPVIPRGQMLAALMLEKKSIALTGSHGKTTTSAMISWILQQLDFDPTCILGGQAMSEGKNSRIGRGDWLVVEGDESDGSFSQMQPNIAVINNIDADHLDYYGTMQALYQHFYQFIHHLSPLSSVLVNIDCLQHLETIGEINRKVFVFGKVDPDLASSQSTKSLDYGYSDIRRSSAGSITNTDNGTDYAFTFHHTDGEKYLIKTNQPGEHNISNATVAVAVATMLGIHPEKLTDVLLSFPTVARRFQILTQSSVPVVLDYGHHPTELAYTFATVRELWPEREMVVVFEPHRYTRTQQLIEEFAAVLAQVENLCLAPIYEASEPKLDGVSSEWLQQKIAAQRSVKGLSYALPHLIENTDQIMQHWDDLDRNKQYVFLFQGAGNINNWAEQLTPELNRRYQ